MVSSFLPEPRRSLERARRLQRQLLRFDERHMAVVDAGAADEAAHQSDGSCRNSRSSGSLVSAGNSLSATLGMMTFWLVVTRTSPLPYCSRDAREIEQLLRGDPPDRHVQADGAEPRLLLARDAEVIVRAGWSSRRAPAAAAARRRAAASSCRNRSTPHSSIRNASRARLRARRGPWSRKINVMWLQSAAASSGRQNTSERRGRPQAARSDLAADRDVEALHLFARR